MGKAQLKSSKMSLPRTMNTRELEKGASVVTPSAYKSLLSYHDLLTFPDPRLTIGSQVPIPFVMDQLIPYVGDNTFGRKRQRSQNIMVSPEEVADPFKCEYCNCIITNYLEHSKTNKCQLAQMKINCSSKTF